MSSNETKQCRPCQGPEWCRSVYAKFSKAPRSKSWRHHLEHFLQLPWLNALMVLLLICDLVLVIVCLELQILSEQAMIAEFDRCDKEYAAGISVPAGLDNTLNNPLGVPVCKPDLQRANSLHEAEIILAWCSVTILAIFLAENLLLIVCQGLEYFTDFFYVMELFVVSFSLALELVFLLAATPAANIGSLFIIARTWRFARVAHGFYFLEHSSEHSAQGGDTEKHAGKEPS